ncbi:MAG: T9SS type A sorting domain-containing protein [Chitinivibrionales bacterium]|nr:T9SS type A sorting domain-containing protein [Chitinivibrionales bacterium]
MHKALLKHSLLLIFLTCFLSFARSPGTILNFSLNAHPDSIVKVGDTVLFSASISDDTGGVRHEYDLLITWMLIDTSKKNPALFSAYGATNKWSPTRAYGEVKIIGRFMIGAETYIDTLIMHTIPGLPDHLVIEPNPAGQTISPWTDSPVGGNSSLTIRSMQASNSVYAVVRDKFQNFIINSASTQWDTLVNGKIAKVANGNPLLGEGVITALGVAGSLQVRAKALDYPNIQTLVDTIFVNVIDTIKPVVNITSPVGNEQWKGDSTYSIAWTATDNAGIKARAIYLDANNIKTKLDSENTNDGSWAWSVPNSNNTLSNCKIILLVYDNSGNMTADTSQVFTIISNVPTRILSPLNKILPKSLSFSFSNSGRYNIEVGIERQSDFSIKIYSIAGREIFYFTKRNAIAGWHSVQLENNLMQGVYIAKLIRDSNIISQLIVTNKR